MRFNSIRARLQLWYGLFLLVILTGFGLSAYELENGHIIGRTDRELHRRVNYLLNSLHHPQDRGELMEEGPDGDPPPFLQNPPGGFRGAAPAGGPPGGPPDGPPGFGPGHPRHWRRDFNQDAQTAWFDPEDPNKFYYLFFTADHQVISRSSNAPPHILTAAQSITPPRPPPDSPRLEENSDQEQLAFDGNRMEYQVQMPRGGYLVVGCTLAPELLELRLLALKLTLAGAIIMVLGLGGGWWLATRAIQPISDISSTAAKISAGDLSQRINVADTESELGHLATVLNSTFARLEAAFAQQQQFTSDAAHELRTPVSVMLTQAQLSLSRERSPAEYRQTIESCKRAAQRMRRLIESLLALARLDAGQEPMKRLEFDLATVIGDCAELVQPLAGDRNVTLTVAAEAIECTGDPERIAQVVTNLLTNAIHYNRPQGEVRVTAGHQNATAVISVQDTGTGIAAGDLPRVFERFYRSDKSRSSGGQGLGLSICKSIITAHGGNIEVTSEVGVGTTFTVRLPVG